MEEIKMEAVGTKYGAYLLPVLCFVVGVLIGFLLSPVKSGKVTLLSNNTVGSKNGCGNSAGCDNNANDPMVCARKDSAS